MGPPALAAAVQAVHQFVTFCVATPLQEAIAVAFEEAEKVVLAEETCPYRSLEEVFCWSAIHVCRQAVEAARLAAAVRPEPRGSTGMYVF